MRRFRRPLYTLLSRTLPFDAARAEARWAEKDRNDKAQLHEQKVVSRSAFEQASAVADAKKSLVAVAEAQVEIARKNLKDAVVVAPFAGAIGERFANPGESIPVDGKLFSEIIAFKRKGKALTFSWTVTAGGTLREKGDMTLNPKTK